MTEPLYELSSFTNTPDLSKTSLFPQYHIKQHAERTQLHFERHICICIYYGCRALYSSVMMVHCNLIFTDLLFNTYLFRFQVICICIYNERNSSVIMNHCNLTFHNFKDSFEITTVYYTTFLISFKIVVH